MLFTHITSRVSGEKYPRLLSEKGGRGFPYIIFMNEKGKVLAVHRGPRTVESFHGTVGQAEEYLALAAKEDKTLDEKITLFQLDSNYGNLTVEEAEKAIAAMEGLTDEQRRQLDGALMNLVVKELTSVGRRLTEEEVQDLGKKFHELYQAGRIPADDNTVWIFFVLQLRYAEAIKDATSYETALNEIRERLGENRRYSRALPQFEEKLEELKQDGER